jgi:hypothetical protein
MVSSTTHPNHLIMIKESQMGFPPTISGWWCNNHLETYEFVNGKDCAIIVETTNKI